MANDLVKNCNSLSGLSACKCCRLWTYWQQSDWLVYHWVHWPMVVCVDVTNFLLFLIVFASINCFKFMLLRKAIMGCKLLKISLKLLLMLNKCQCLFIISFIFGRTGFYVNESGTKPLRLDLQCFKLGLSPSKKIRVICIIENPLKIMENIFYFILKALFVLKIFKFL